MDVHARVVGERGRQPSWEAGLVELAPPPGRNRGALCSIGSKDGPHVDVGVATPRILTVVDDPRTNAAVRVTKT
jgi:hypothetical protein